MANTPARTTKKKAASESDSDVVLIRRHEDDGSFEAEIFGTETFLFSDDVNGFLLLNAVRDGSGFLDLMDSLVLVPDADGADDDEIEKLRDAERERFHKVLATQKRLSIERLAKMVGDLTEIAGNESGDSSSSD